MIMDEKVEIEFVALGCGHSVNPRVGVGLCSKCGKICCSKCLQLFKDKLLCPSCFREEVESDV